MIFFGKTLKNTELWMNPHIVTFNNNLKTGWLEAGEGPGRDEYIGLEFKESIITIFYINTYLYSPVLSLSVFNTLLFHLILYNKRN